MSKIIDRTGKGSAISQAEFDANYDSLHGINQAIAGTTHTVDISDQGDTLEFTSASAVAVTLDSIATIAAALHTSDYKVTLIAIGAGVVTITPDGLNTINTGAGTIVLAQNEYVTIQTDSTGLIWNIIDSSDVTKLSGLTVGQFLRSDANDTATGNITFTGIAKLAGTWEISGVPVISSATELNLLDGATVTTAEINNIDGGTSATATTSADADRVVYNDAGVMKQVALTDLDTYFSQTTKTLTNKTLTSPALTDPTLTNPVINTSVSGTAFLDEDDMASDSAAKFCSQQSIKAYVDSMFAVLSTPVVLVSASATLGSWTTVTLSASYAGATSAKVVLALSVSRTSTSFTGNFYLRETGSGLSANSVTKKTSISQQVNTSTGLAGATGGEFVVSLNSSRQFDWYTTGVGITANTTLYLVGYSIN